MSSVPNSRHFRRPLLRNSRHNRSWTHPFLPLHHGDHGGSSGLLIRSSSRLSALFGKVSLGTVTPRHEITGVLVAVLKAQIHGSAVVFRILGVVHAAPRSRR